MSAKEPSAAAAGRLALAPSDPGHGRIGLHPFQGLDTFVGECEATGLDAPAVDSVSSPGAPTKARGHEDGTPSALRLAELARRITALEGVLRAVALEQASLRARLMGRRPGEPILAVRPRCPSGASQGAPAGARPLADPGTISATSAAGGGRSPYLDADQAAAYLGITVKSLYGVVERGHLTPLRGPRRRYRFTAAMLDEYLARRAVR